MTSDDIKKLTEPKAEDFSPDVWAAVNYAREWALSQGNVENIDTVKEFEKHYSRGSNKSKSIMTIIRTMNLANKTMNSLTARKMKRRMGERQPM